VLKGYLVATSQVEFEWPPAENGRSHIEHVIGFEELPVRHSLLKKGRPYSLRLEKTAGLFKRAEAERRSLEQDLTWIKGVAREICARS
jgi:hypothetical protein